MTNSFVQAILPGHSPTEAEMRETLARLGQQWEDRRCVYCGERSTDFDHFRAIVRDRRPSGYLTEAKNLVPACGTCNQSKGGRDWREWILGNAAQGPARRGVQDIPERVALLDVFAEWADCQKGNIVGHVDPDLWRSYWAKLNAIERLMAEAQEEAAQVRVQIAEGMVAEAVAKP